VNERENAHFARRWELFRLALHLTSYSVSNPEPLPAVGCVLLAIACV